MRVCILGATGLVGRELLHLVPRAWPGAQLALYASRDQDIEVDGRRFEVRAAHQLDAVDATGGELAFVALDDEHSARYVPRLLALGYRVIDKSNAYRGDPAVPLVAAGVNDGLVADEVRLVANPNCTTIPLTLALAPLRRRFGIRNLAVSTYQAISGAGIAALDQYLLDAQVGYAAQNRLGLAFSPAGYAGNTVPHNGKTDDTGYSAEERKLMTESSKILAFADLPISAQACRVAVAVGHYEQVWLTCDQPVSLDGVGAAWAEGAFLRVVPTADGTGLSALACVHERDLALVGRVRRVPHDPTAVCFTVAADNLRLGAATNAVRIAARWYPAVDPVLQAPGNLP